MRCPDFSGPQVQILYSPQNYIIKPRKYNLLMEFLKKYFLLFVVFITGAAVLIIEIVAVRILSPYYGNTIFTVSSVISVILAALSFGYYIGGKLADKYPFKQWFFSIILSSGLILLILHILGNLLLPDLSLSFSLSFGPLISSIFLFLIPAILLGMLSPYVIKLQSIQTPKQGIGSISGKIFFWSTLGSIVGSLLAGFVLIPIFGVNQIIIATSLSLFILGLLPLIFIKFNKKYLIFFIFLFLLILGFYLLKTNQENKNIIYKKDGIYEKIIISNGFFNNRPIRLFKQDHSISGAMFLDSDDPLDLVFDYTKYYSLYKLFTPEIENALIIGGGAYSIPKALLKELPNIKIDVSEIEPSLFELSKKYFQVPDVPNLKSYTADGRRLLSDSKKKYDLIFSDVYYSYFSVPAHFTTQEFFKTSKEKLTKNGVFIASMIGDLSRQKPSLIMSEIKTFKTVFPNSYFFAVNSPKINSSQNIVFVGYNGDKTINFNDPQILNNSNKIIRSLESKKINLARFELSEYPILTDNFSPVEYLTGQVLKKNNKNSSFLNGQEMLALIAQQLRYGPRYLNSEGHKKIQKFLIAEMQELTPKLEIQEFQYTGQNNIKYNLKNIIGKLYPQKEERIILATHYDSKKLAYNDKNKPNEAVPGANDSASGVAILLELTRLLIESQKTPNIGIDIIFFDGEEGEGGLAGDYTNWIPLGSSYFAENLNQLYTKKPTEAIVLDMLCKKNLKLKKEASSLKDAPIQIENFWNIAKKVNSNIFVNDIGPTILDDHTPLNKIGIPSILLIDYDYPYFHTTEDTTDKCSATNMEIVATALYNYIFSLN